MRHPGCLQAKIQLHQQERRPHPSPALQQEAGTRQIGGELLAARLLFLPTSAGYS